MTRDSKESVLSRWSRRKLEAEQPADTSDEVSSVVESAHQVEAPASQVELEKPPLTDADMPAIESLTEDSDYSGFMSAGVSDELRNLALRKLFGAPVFNIRDGLDEYDEDYTYFEKLGDIVTCDMKHQIEMKEQKRREALAQEAEEEAAAPAPEAEEEVEILTEEAEAEADGEMEAMESIDDDADTDERAEFVANAEPEPEITKDQRK
jgi:hypothetical protein